MFNRQIFIAGTSTNIGKTIVSAWFGVNGFEYFKPIQCGFPTDTNFIEKLNIKTYPEIYKFKKALSPHLACGKENIDIKKIVIPKHKKPLVIEGCGGVYVPINKNQTMLEVMQYLNIPVIIVTSLKIGTINHTCLTIMALKLFDIPILGFISSGEYNQENKDSIAHYGKIKFIGHLPYMENITINNLKKHKLDLTSF